MEEGRERNGKEAKGPSSKGLGWEGEMMERKGERKRRRWKRKG